MRTKILFVEIPLNCSTHRPQDVFDRALEKLEPGFRIASVSGVERKENQENPYSGYDMIFYTVVVEWSDPN